MVDAKSYEENGNLYIEPPEPNTGLTVAIEVKDVLFQKKTPFQNIRIIDTGHLGRALILDGNIQCTEFDEAAYHEMIVHVPLLTHPDPKRVLVIGGGDGGTIREVTRHSGVERIDICEIDGEVIDACRRYLPALAGGFDDPRVNVHVRDGASFVAGLENVYDVVIVDSSDPVGPARILFSPEFYDSLKQALRPGGLAVSQAESFYFYGGLIREILGFLDEKFEFALYYTTMVPTYVSGIIGFAFSSLGPNPLHEPDAARLETLGPLDYYTPAVHKAAFALPEACLRLLPPKVAAVQGGDRH